MDDSVKKRKIDYTVVLILVLILASMVTLGIVIVWQNAVQQDAADYTVNVSGQLQFEDPFKLPTVANSQVLNSSDDSVIFEVQGTVIEALAEFMFGLADSGRWIVVEPSSVPSALTYQEILIQHEEGKQVKVSVEELTETTVKMTASGI